MEHLVKLLRDSYDLQEEKSEETAYWHLQKLRSAIKQLTLTDVSSSLPNESELTAEEETRKEKFEHDLRWEENRGNDF